MASRVGVIDIGSNSVRMVVYEKSSRYAFHLIHEAKSRVRLSQDAYQNGGELQTQPMQNTIDALRDFLTIISSLKARKTLCVATSALRDAPNQKEFIKRVKDELKLNIKVIDGNKEAYYGAISCANLLPKLTSSLTIDIGGGSTEFALINEHEVTQTLSLKLGTVRLKELYFDKNDISGAVAYIDSELEAIPLSSIAYLVGIGGTFRAIAKAIIEHIKYPLNKLHAFESDATEFRDFIELILDSDNSKLQNLGIDANRLDVIKPGALILSRLFLKLDIEKTITSRAGVREGVYLCDLLRNSKHKFPMNYNTSLRSLMDNHLSDTTLANQLSLIAKKIFDLTHHHLKIDATCRYELSIASRLTNIGSSLHYYTNSKNSYNLIKSSLEYGFTHTQILLIATLARYAKHKEPSESHLLKYEKILPRREIVKSLSFIISLSSALLTHRPRNIDFDIDFKDGVIIVTSKSGLYLSREAVKKISSLESLKVEFA